MKDITLEQVNYYILETESDMKKTIRMKNLFSKSEVILNIQMLIDKQEEILKTLNQIKQKLIGAL